MNADEIQSENSGVPNLNVDPTFLQICFQEHHQVLMIKSKEESPGVSDRGRRTVYLFEICTEHSP